MFTFCYFIPLNYDKVRHCIYISEYISQWSSPLGFSCKCTSREYYNNKTVSREGSAWVRISHFAVTSISSREIKNIIQSESFNCSISNNKSFMVSHCEDAGEQRQVEQTSEILNSENLFFFFSFRRTKDQEGSSNG